MTGEISRNTYVVVTRNFGNFHVFKERADNIDRLLDMPDNSRPYKIDIDGARIVVSNIIGIMSASQYEDVEKQKKGMWKCMRGNWHEKYEKCQCGWGMDTKLKESKAIEPSTPEAKNRFELIKKMRENGIGIVVIGQRIRGKTDREIKEMLDSYE